MEGSARNPTKLLGQRRNYSAVAFRRLPRGILETTSLRRLIQKSDSMELSMLAYPEL
jgi:hypothetical protein